MNVLPIPGHFDPARCGIAPWRVDYNALEASGLDWIRKHGITPAATDKTKIALMLIDVQNTFCTPDFELFVGGRSGRGAVDDSIRSAEFIYQNLATISRVFLTMDTHSRMQVFHPAYWVDESGNHPAPFTIITLDDVQSGKWKVDVRIAHSVANGNFVGLQKMALHYVQTLTNEGKYPLIIWPPHAMLGGIGHAIVSTIEEAAYFHNVCRSSKTGYEIKGGNPLTENYSILRPEVLTGPDGAAIAQKNAAFFNTLTSYDYLIIGGQAASHCVAWTIADLLTEINAKDPNLAQKCYILRDCTSPVVIPGVIDFTDQAEAKFQEFAAAGMHIVDSKTPIDKWPGVIL